MCVGVREMHLFSLNVCVRECVCYLKVWYTQKKGEKEYLMAYLPQKWCVLIII